ncbi:hypothetical protein OEZ86_004214 [Tetradesmus obliquus]|nr:hypothetical protein OEZ86_004214 [Tetradesmus obliquus]
MGHGYAAHQPGLLLPRAYPTPWPTPLAYFPLSQDLSSYPDAAWSGFTHKAALNPSEPRWGSALACNADSAAYAALDPAPYAASGAFAVSIWLKMAPRDDSSSSSSSIGGSGLAGGFRYVLSHGAAGSSGSVYEQSNQVALFLPGPGHPRLGVLRAVIRDWDDITPATRTYSRTDVWIDSDGRIGDNSRSGSSSSSSSSREVPLSQNPNMVDFEDGEWHHVVLSTLPAAPSSSSSSSSASNRRGYRLYVDGLLRAELSSSRNRKGPPTGSSSGSSSSSSSSSSRVHVAGGDPLTLTGPLTLCARADRDPLSFFSGQLFQLALFDQPLGEAQVAALYAEYSKQALLYPRGGSGE